MSKFSETFRPDTPCLVIEHKRDGNKDLFGWGMVGEIEILPLVGAMVRVQAEVGLCITDPGFNDRDPHYCDQQALVIAWDASKRAFDWFVHPSIPVDNLIGMMDVVKTGIISSYIIQQQAMRQNGMILGPDGQPVRR